MKSVINSWIESTKHFKGPTIFLIALTLERFVFYSLDSNMVLLFTNVAGLPQNTANTVALAWKGVSFCLSVFGAYIADFWVGCYKTMLLGYTLYSAGMVIVTLGVTWSERWIWWIGSLLVAVSVGLVRPNSAKFGGDQFHFEEQKEQLRISFFSWLYFSASVGGVVGYLGMSYIQQHVSLVWGLGIPAIFMIIGTVILGVGSGWFVDLPPSNMSLKELGKQICSSEETDPESAITDPSTKGSTTKVVVFLLFMLVFWCHYAQLSSILYTQSLVLKLQLFSLQLPSTISHLFNIFAILLLVPLFQKIVYPTLAQYKFQFSLLNRVAVGLLLATMAMVYSGCVEVYRMKLIRDGQVVSQHVGGQLVEAADLSVVVQAPAFFIIGAGEVLACVTALEYAYQNSPPSMKSMVLAFNSLMNASGHYLGSLLILITNALSSPIWIGEDPNQSHLEYYLFVLSIIGFINFFIYLGMDKMSINFKNFGQWQQSKVFHYCS